MSGSTGKNLSSSMPVLRRLPRPYGATSLAIQYKKTKAEKEYRAFVDFMVHQWFIGNGIICGVSYDIQEIASSLHIPVEEIRCKMRDQLIESRIWDKDKQDQMLYGLMGNMVSWTMEDRMKVNAQLDLLIKSQGGKYTPFISAEVNKALKLSLESSTALQAVVGRLMGGGGTTNIFTFNQQNNDNSVNNNYVTTSEVLEIINENDKQLDKSEQAKLLESKYDLSSLPVVVATEQEGIDTSKEGLGGKINQQLLNQVTDNMKAAMEASDEDHHAMRREIEMNIDQDADDPELDQYDDYEEGEEQTFSARNYLK